MKRSVIRSNNNKEAVTSVIFIITDAAALEIILPLIKVDCTLDAFHGDIFNGLIKGICHLAAAVLASTLFPK